MGRRALRRDAEEAARDVERPDCDDQTRSAAGHGKQQRLDEKLSDEPGAAGAEREADGDLPSPSQAPCEQQTGDVCRRDEQHERRRRGDERHDRSVPRLFVDADAARFTDHRASSGVDLGKLRGELTREQRHLRLCILECRVIGQPAIRLTMRQSRARPSQ